jgi:CO/xanthine dehydrogenase FAD-binding subunit
MEKYKIAAPTTLSQTLALLVEYGPDAALLAGGTDLVNHIRIGKRAPKILIQLRKVKDLSSNVEEDKDGVVIGAMATLSDIAASTVLRREFPAIAEAAGKVGSKQIRNRATMAGNICNASPAADTVPALLLYDAVINVAGDNGRRVVPMESFVLCPNKTCLNAGEIVESIFLPRPSTVSGSAYIKLARRDGVDLAMVGVGVFTSAEGEVRVALGAVGPTAIRARAAEKLVAGGLQNGGLMEQGLDMVVSAASPITDLRATREYRLAMIRALTQEAIGVSLDRMTNGGWRK